MSQRVDPILVSINLADDAITLVGYDGDGVRVDLNHLRHLVVLFL